MDELARDAAQLHKEQAARKRRKNRDAVAQHYQGMRDLGPTLPIIDIERRESCRFDFARFCTTYNPSAFYLEWSSIHRQAIKRIEETVLDGALYAFAMPRGTGKSTLSKMAAWWALSYGHRRYVFLIGATMSKATELLESVKIWCRFGQPWIDDFPEISQGVRELRGKGNAASGQTQLGESTMVVWSKEKIVLPTVQPPPNYPWPGEPGPVAPSSGSMIGVSGLTGDGIRGSVVTTMQGEELRPDLVLADDPQTDKSAKSITQNQDRYDLMTGAVLGMAGPDKDISLLMPCTVIKAGDMVSTVLDRKRNPLFRGQTTSMLNGMPDLEKWEQYFALYQYGAQQEPPDYQTATDYYLEHQAEMDEGAVATWPERHLDREVSGIQHAMNLYCRNPKTFFAEYQNDPQDDSTDRVFLTAEEITNKQHPWGQLEAPVEVEKITAYIDVQQELLFWVVFGWSSRFDGYMLARGTYPDQVRLQFDKLHLHHNLRHLYPEGTEDGRIYQALCDLRDILFQTRLTRADGATLQLDAIGVDRRYKSSTVKRFVRDSRDARIVPTFGGRWGGTEKPMNHPDYIKKWTTGGRRLGPNWRLGDAQQGVQSIEINPNFWKTFLHEGLATPLGDPGSISLYRDEPFKHQLFAQHLTAEYRERITSRWGEFDIWKVKPGAGDNDWLDCSAGACVMASYLGISTMGVDPEELSKQTRRRVDGSKWGDTR